jgi:hypothetical protein
MLHTKSSADSKPSKVPLTHSGLQYNCCKNPKCPNYGVDALSTSSLGMYSLISGGKQYPLLKCNACGETPPMKSNVGISEELDRLSAYLHSSSPKTTATCPDPACQNHSVPVSTKKAYRSFGTSSSGAKRLQCSICKKTFSIAKATVGQHETHYNIDIFKLLVNKVPLSRIINILEINWSVLYNRIDFIHKQCLAFAADREKELSALPIKRLYIAVDKQDYQINWTERKDKRNITLSAIASADNKTGYVFGIHPNFDYSLNRDVIEDDAFNVKDESKASPYRKYARLWLQCDYKKSVEQTKIKKATTSLTSSIEQKYQDSAQRFDVEACDEKSATEKLPSYGMQVKVEYTMIAHFYFLKNLLGNVEKFRFFLDQEPGIRAAFLSAFKDNVKNKTAEAFYVSIEKFLTVDEKRSFKAAANKRLAELKFLHPLCTDEELKLELLKLEIQKVMELGNYKDKWVKHPLPSMAESNKAVCWLTEHDEFDLNHKAWLYNKASLHAVDSFFEKVRRRISMMERPIHSSANRNRVWNGYSAYNPAMIVKLLDIFRVVHNYIDVKKKVGETEKITPAMCLGLAKAPLDYKTILYFE